MDYDYKFMDAFHSQLNQNEKNSGVVHSPLKKAFIILLLFILAVLYFKFNIQDFDSKKRATIEEENKGPVYISTTIPGIELDKTDQLIDTNYKNSVYSIIDRKSNDISPIKPVLGGKWFVIKVSFIDPPLALVEYEDGHIESSLLVNININIEMISQSRRGSYTSKINRNLGDTKF